MTGPHGVAGRYCLALSLSWTTILRYAAGCWYQQAQENIRAPIIPSSLNQWYIIWMLQQNSHQTRKHFLNLLLSSFDDLESILAWCVLLLLLLVCYISLWIQGCSAFLCLLWVTVAFLSAWNSLIIHLWNHRDIFPKRTAAPWIFYPFHSILSAGNSTQHLDHSYMDKCTDLLQCDWLIRYFC